jgi:hypothetical protein
LNAAEQRADAAATKAAAAKRAAAETAELRKKDKAEQAALGDRLAAAELALDRLEVCLDAGLPREAADRLRGATREELTADAADLLALRARAR